jgi:MFS transporter, Spinster family, sphingosine-1-phosphate transporter
VIAGYSLAAWLNESFGWRMMFVLLGAPGLLIAVAARVTLREPRLTAPAGAGRTSLSVSLDENPKRPSVREVCVRLFSISTFRHLLLFLSVSFFFMYGLMQWQPTFFIRSHGFSSAQIGAWFALSYGVAGLLGNYVGGAWASRYARHDEQRQLRIVSVATTGSAVLSAGVYVSPSPYLALVLMSFVVFLLNVCSAPTYATIQTLVPERMRATAIAIMLLFANLIGMGLGPLAIGVLSDSLQARAGNESLRYASLILTPGCIWAGWHAWWASKRVLRDIETVPT